MAGTITIIAGARYQDTVTIKDSAGAAIDLTGGEVRLKIATSLGVTNANATLYTSSADGTPYITIDADQVNNIGQCPIDIPGTITKDFTAGNEIWSIRYKAADADVFETDTGTVIINQALHDDEV